MTKSYSALDREIITLAAAWDLIGSMVHYGHFVKEHEIENPTLLFTTREASRLFLIILADFLSVPKNGTFGLQKLAVGGSLGQTYLGHLKRVVEAPQFTGDPSLLASSLEGFAHWLDGFVTIERIWLPSIEYNGVLRVRRIDYLWICGTISKHGFTRLEKTVRKIKNILSENEIRIDDGQSYLVIPEFQNWFQDNIFIASSTIIAWHLNEVRWGIYKYLRSEFQRSYTKTEIIQEVQMYKYDVPSDIDDKLIRSIYWDLMNHIRTSPYFPRFTLDRFARETY